MHLQTQTYRGQQEDFSCFLAVRPRAAQALPPPVWHSGCVAIDPAAALPVLTDSLKTSHLKKCSTDN